MKKLIFISIGVIVLAFTSTILQAQTLYLRFEEAKPRERSNQFTHFDGTIERYFVYENRDFYGRSPTYDVDYSVPIQTVPLSSIINNPNYKTLEDIEIITIPLQTRRKRGRYWGQYKEIYIVEIIPNSTNVNIIRAKLNIFNLSMRY